MLPYSIDDFAAQRWFDANRSQFIDDLCSLVRIKSVSNFQADGYPFGLGCTAALRYILGLAAKLGFEPINDNNYCGSILLQGKSDEEIGIFTHLDVVPEGDGWSYEPYGGTYWNGFVIGRGAADNKGSVICALYLLKFFKDIKVPFHHSIRLFFGCDEEVGMRDIEYYLLKNHAPVFSFAADAPFGVCYGEKGVLSAVITGKFSQNTIISFCSGTSANIVPNTACAKLRFTDQLYLLCKSCKELEVKKEDNYILVNTVGVSTHSANPETSVNAAVVLANALIKNGMLAKQELQAMLVIATTFSDYEGAGINFAFEDNISGKLTHSGGIVAFNKGMLSFTLNIRYPVHTNIDNLREALELYCKAHCLQLQQTNNSLPNYISPDDPAVELLYKACTNTLWPSLQKYVMGGGTYARKLPRAVSYGPGVRPRYSPFKKGHGMGHQPDECVEINVLRNGFRVYCKALPQLDTFLMQEKKENKNDKA